MKPTQTLALVFAFGATALLASPAVADSSGGSGGSSGSLEESYQVGRRAYYQGDYLTAKAKLLEVLAERPKHFASKALLKQIDIKLAGDQGRQLRNKVASVTLPSLDHDNLDLQTALDHLALVASKQSGGKFIPSFVVRGEETGERLVTLTLKKVPMNEVLRYLGEMADVNFHYEKYAIVATPMSTTPKGATPTKALPEAPVATAGEIPAQ